MLAVVQLQKGPRSALGWTPPPRRTLGSFWGSGQAPRPCWGVRRGGAQVGLSSLIPSLLFFPLFWSSRLRSPPGVLPALLGTGPDGAAASTSHRPVFLVDPP